MECLISVLENQIKAEVVIQQDQNAKVEKGGCLTLLHVSIMLACFRLHEASDFTGPSETPFYTGISWLLIRWCHC